MRAAFLDYGTVDAGDLDVTALRLATGDLTLHRTTDTEHVVERLRGCDIALINKIRLGRAQFERLPALRLVALAATGSDNVDIDAAREHGIGIANIRDYCTPSVAQHVFALVLTLSRRLDRYRGLVAGGQWQAPQPFCLLDEPMVDLHGLTLGIVGYGTLGRAVAALAEAFGMNTIIARRPGGLPAPGRVPLGELLECSDVISLHCPLTDATRGLIDSAALAQMRPTAILVNTARGALVDSEALARALREGVIAGAGIDVLPVEPPRACEPLLARDIPNLILTPHVAWASVKARQQALDELAANVVAFEGGVVRNRIDLA